MPSRISRRYTEPERLAIAALAATAKKYKGLGEIPVALAARDRRSIQNALYHYRHDPTRYMQSTNAPIPDPPKGHKPARKKWAFEFKPVSAPEPPALNFCPNCGQSLKAYR